MEPTEDVDAALRRERIKQRWNVSVLRAKDTMHKTKDKLASFADVVQAVAGFDRNGRIHLDFDDDDEKYDIAPMQQYARDVQSQEKALEQPLLAAVPKMNVCIMIVGTRGDVQPFIGIAKRLQQDGHRVRLATHAVYRDFVTEHGVEFYPLGGDPKELAAYMVKTGGHIIPLKVETLTQDMPRNIQQIEEILNSTWPAVSAADPDALGPGKPGKPFQAHAIISNPVTYGHIHVAERLGVPLHIMFPQPWVPTVAFPHPLSNLPYNDQPLKRNYLSYKMVDLLMWQGTESMVNRFRTQVLGLRKIRKGDGGRDILLDLAIPHAFMWSPALVPKPADWGDIYDVIGTVLLKEAGSKYTPTPELEAFLGTDGGPIFVGFGSMVLADPLATTKMIIEAAQRANNVRVLIQSSWSDMSGDLDVPSNIFFLGNCPHDWLMPRVSAVVHHGGAGTTAAGLLAGKPTFIVPFFGDQPFWGRAVVKAGVGVEPCPIGELSVDRLTDAFLKLQDPGMRSRALAIRDVMAREDGVEEAVRVFYRHLPLKNMNCDVCQSEIATKWSNKDKMRMCPECEFVVSSRPENTVDDVVEYHSVDYSSRGPDSTLEGVASGAGAFLHELGSGVKDVFMKPAQGYREEGAKGAVIGLAKGFGGLLIKPIQGAALFADRVATGHYNKHRSSDERKRGSVLNTPLISIGQASAPDAHTAAMRPDETERRNSDKRKSECDQVSVMMTPDEKARLLARFREVQERRRGGELLEAVSIAKSDDGPVQTKTLVANKQGYIDLAELKAFADAQASLQQVKLQAVSQRPVPKMNICMITTGTWNDGVQQFVAIGQRLKADGHRVRVATNENFRNRVKSAGLEFFPLGGRASTIGRYITHQHAVQYQKRGLFGLGKSREEFGELEDLRQLVFSLWPACVEADPLQPGMQFRADAIISHPLIFGQAIVAERLGVPLHCLSATPTARSHAFPHWMTPNVKLSTPYRYTAANGASYDTVDSALWGGLRDILDEFRASVGLLGYTTGRNLLSEWRIPHSFLWNPSILPRPLDWGYEIKIHGYVEVKQEPGPAQAAELISSFVTDSNTAVVYFGFSSGDWDDRRLADLLKEVEKAAVAANVRVVFQTLEDAEGRSLYRSPHVMEVPSSVSLKLILPCAVAAIHWGDISITSTCLSVGIPVCVVPRNQTQRVWGQALALAGVGLEPVELSALSSANLVNIFQDLQHTTLVSTARDLANNSASSDVAADAMVKWFYANLPVDGMTCDLDPSRIARIYDPERQLKLSYEGQRVVQEETGDFALNDFKYKPLKYSISHPPRYSLRQLEQSDPNGDAKVTLKIAFDAPEMATTGMEGIARIGGDRKRGLSRYQSMAANVIETPSTWTSADIRDRRMADINARYEQLLSSRR
ncbi:hypothetical protein PINS_up005949 [Pythium insidiosum]|nr:hypothetical protein PINS_up005949 [Pythium insidiosum]